MSTPDPTTAPNPTPSPAPTPAVQPPSAAFIERAKATGIALVLYCLSAALLMLAVKMRWPEIAKFIADIILVLSGLLPVFLILVWVPFSHLFQKIFGRRFVTLAKVAALLAYGIYAEQKASEELNYIFKIDPNHFGITTKLLVTVLVPVKLEVWASGPLWILLILIAAPLAIYVCLVACGLWAGPPMSRKSKIILALVMGVCGAMAVDLPLIDRMGTRLSTMVERVALWADFNPENRCNNQALDGSEGVIFLENGSVLAAFASATAPTSYRIESCSPVIDMPMTAPLN